MMNEYERIDYLVKVLEGNNAKAFCIKTGIAEASLSRVRKGNGRPAAYYGRIVTAYPQVRKQWLYSGAGEPMKEKKEKGEVLQKIESLEREVKRLSSLIEKMAKCQESTNCK